MNEVTREKTNFFQVILSGYNQPVWATPDDPEVEALMGNGLTQEEALDLHHHYTARAFREAVYMSPEVKWADRTNADYVVWIAPDEANPIFLIEFLNDRDAARFAIKFLATEAA